MKVAIFDVCRSPEIKKETEALILSSFFNQEKIDYEVYSNDGIWLNKKVLNKDLIRQHLKQSDAEIIHLAMHGDNQGLILKWSKAQEIKERVPEDVLTSLDIKTTSEWQGRVVVSGACSSAQLSRFFLEAGATGVIAPSTPIPWLNLGRFFQVFYQALFSSQPTRSALALAIAQFPKFNSYQVYSRSD
jgi:CHAT domain-containing protein